MIYHSIENILAKVRDTVGEDRLLQVMKWNSSWTTAFFNHRKEHPVFEWAYREIIALDIWHYQGRHDADAYLRSFGIYD